MQSSTVSDGNGEGKRGMRGLPSIRERIVVLGADDEGFIQFVSWGPELPDRRTGANNSPALMRDCQASLPNGNGGERDPTRLEIAGQSIIPTAGPQVLRLVHLQQFRIHALLRPRARLLVRRFCRFLSFSFSFRRGRRQRPRRRSCRARFCAGFVTRERSQASVGF